MGFRFRKSFKVAPGVRLNFSTRGVSLSAGVPGARVTVGSTGTRTTVGLPGTGLSYTTRSSSTRPAQASERRTPSRRSPAVPGHLQQLQFQTQARQAALREQAQRERDRVLRQAILSLGDNGELDARDRDDHRLSPTDLKRLWALEENRLKTWLVEQKEVIDQEARLIADIHRDTPHPDDHPSFQPKPFTVAKPPKPVDVPFQRPEPAPPTLPPLGFWSRLFERGRLNHQARCRSDAVRTAPQHDPNRSVQIHRALFTPFNRSNPGRRLLTEAKSG